MNTRKDQIEAIFGAAIELNSPEQRAVYLAKVCGDDNGLRREIEELIQAYHKAGGFLTATSDHAEAVSRSEVSDATVLLPVTEKPGDRIGRYKLLQQIGEGGCGVVYMAEQEEPIRRRVAFKVIKLGMDTKQVIARFEAERQALALMDHPNIAKVFDGGATDTGRPYFVLELVRGVRITDYCDQNHLATADRLKLFIQVCHAIQHAHQKGIIHRDIKPSNILVSLHDDVPVPKVIDFGIAKAMGERLTDKTFHTQFEQFMGTPAYMSPEQAGRSDLDIDTRSDIYALGVLLYELLAGRPPFDPKQLAEAGLEEMVRCIREEEPLRPSTRLSQLQQEELTTTAQRRGTESPKLIHLLRGDLDWIVMKCLEKNRTRRYEAANALALDIERHLNNEPVAARPPSTAYRIEKFVRRNKVLVAAGSAVAMALVLGVVVSTWQALRATRAEERAEAALQKESAERLKAEQAQAREADQRRLAVQAGEVAQRNLYVANMNLAAQAWEQNNIGRLRQVLEETQESPYRGFEWYYWQPKTHLALKTLRGHLDVVPCAAFSPDGQRIVTGSWDQTAKVWEAASGRELLKLEGHSDIVTAVTFSPNGQRIVTGSDDRTARVWEAASGRELLTLKARSDFIKCVAFSPDGQRIVTGSYDSTAEVWEAARAEQVAVWQQEERAAAQSLEALRRERTAEEERERILRAHDSIKQWLIMAPIPLAAGQSGAAALELELIAGEAGLRPKPGETAPFGGGALKWREVALTNEVLDFNASQGQQTTQSVAYAVCYLQSEGEQRGLRMLVGSDDQSKVYLNGREVYRCSIDRPFYAEQDQVSDVNGS